jgi:hypothetical protein
MSPKEFDRLIHELGFSQQRAGEWLGYSKRTGQRFALGEKEVPAAVAMLLRVMTRYRITIEEAERA